MRARSPEDGFTPWSPAVQSAIDGLLAALDLGLLVYDQQEIVHYCNDAMRSLVPDPLWPPNGHPRSALLNAWGGRFTAESTPALARLEPNGPARILTRDRPPKVFRRRVFAVGDCHVETFEPELTDPTDDRAAFRFVARAAHDLKSPLTSIRGFAQLAQRRAGNVDSRIAQNLQTIISQSDRLVSLIDTLVDVARLSSGRLEVRPRQADLGAILNAAVAARAGANSRLTVTLTVAPDPLLGVWDGGRLTRVFESLLDFLVRSSAAERTASIRAVGTADRTTVTIEAPGPELATSELAEIADPRSAAPDRLPGNLERVRANLTLAHQIVVAHGGALEFDVRSGRRTRITVHLPREVVFTPATDAP